MKDWTSQQLADAAGAALLHAGAAGGGPDQVVIDSRRAQPGALFVGLPGASFDGGQFAEQALAAGAWGVMAGTGHASSASRGRGAVLAADDPLHALQSLATQWRRHLAADVIGVTGSTGKTSTKELLNALIAPHRRTRASQANFNTEIGLPLEICNTPKGTEVLVLEMGMRGPGQIAELAAIAEPDVAVIVSIGPVHLELMGSVEAIAAAKAELIAGLRPGAAAVVPADEPLLVPHYRDDIDLITFGAGGEVRALAEDTTHMEIDARGRRIPLEVPFTQAHLRRNLLAAVAAAHAVGVAPRGRVDFKVGAGRGRVIVTPRTITVIDDCYNANPMSMRAALEDLARVQGSTGGAARGRRVAILGDMLELGPDELRFHREVGETANRAEVELLITVGPLAAAMTDTYDHGDAHTVTDAVEAAAVAEELLQPGDTVLVKGSNGVRLEHVVEALAAGEGL